MIEILTIIRTRNSCPDERGPSLHLVGNSNAMRSFVFVQRLFLCGLFENAQPFINRPHFGGSCESNRGKHVGNYPVVGLLRIWKLVCDAHTECIMDFRFI
ncbi:unnamed protein product [Leptosia nina]|uniref:Uncharacterized protein n=1 Tax=Leptosia nina TaxID=320188 RepID=A0AAV1IVB8_9NEOP